MKSNHEKRRSGKPRCWEALQARICIAIAVLCDKMFHLGTATWYAMAGYVRCWSACMACEYYLSTIVSGQLVRDAMKRKGICQGAALFVMLFGLLGIFTVVTDKVDPTRSGWILHQSSWNLGGGVLALIAITKYGKILAYFQATPPWTMPVRWKRHGLGRVGKRRRITSCRNDALPLHRTICQMVQRTQGAVFMWGVGRFVFV